MAASWGFAPDPTGGAYSAPQTPGCFKGSYTSKGWEGKETRRRGRGNEGKREERGGLELVRLGLSPPKVKFLVTSLTGWG